MCSFDEAATGGGPILRGDDLILEAHRTAQNRGETGREAPRMSLYWRSTLPSRGCMILSCQAEVRLHDQTLCMLGTPAFEV